MLKKKTLKISKAIKIMLAAVLLVSSFLPTGSAFAANPNDDQNSMDANYAVGVTNTGKTIMSSMNFTKATGNSSGSASANYGGYTTSTSFITIDGEPAFCINPEKDFPLNAEYIEEVYTDEGVYNILYYGYPNNGVSEKNYMDTYVALNYYLGHFDSPTMAADPGVAYLLDKANNPSAPHGSFDIGNKVQTAAWDSSIGFQATDWYTTTNVANGTFTLNLPAGVSVLTDAGQLGSGSVTLSAGTSFKLLAEASYDGTVTLDVPTNIAAQSALLFQPNNPNNQQLVSMRPASDPITVHGIQATFHEVFGELIVNKINEDMNTVVPGATFSLTSNATGEVKTGTTDEYGNYLFSDLLPGTYTLVETSVPAPLLVDSTPATIEIKAGERSVYYKKNKQPLGKVKIIKTDSETGAKPQGDASLNGAEFDIVNSGGQVVDHAVLTGTTWESEPNLPLGDYIAIETKAPHGYVLDPTPFPFKIEYVDQNTPVVSVTANITNDVIKGNIDLQKFYSEADGESAMLHPEQGAEFTAYSKTTGKQVGEPVVTDENGHASFNNMPFGWYIIKQTKTPAGMIKVGDFEVNVSEDGKTYYYNMVNAKFKSLVKIVKIDEETGKSILSSDTTFKVKDLQTGKWVTQTVNYPTQVTLDEFKTNNQGELILPLPLAHGDYELYELSAPSGYVLDKEPLKFSVNEENQENGMITVEFGNKAQKGIATLNKTGDTLVGASSPKMYSEYGTIYNLRYNQKPLAGTEFDFVAAEDITTGDGTVRAKKGEVVGHGTTNSKGQLKSPELYLGKYNAVETKAPVGYVVDSTPIPFELKYAGQEVELTSTSIKAENNLQELQILTHKEDESIKYEDGKPVVTTVPSNDKVFGVFTRNAIKVDDEEVVPANGLLAVTTTENGIAEVEQKFPAGNYYVKELNAGDSHNLNEKEYDFSFKPENNDPIVTVDIYADEEMNPIINELHKEKLVIKKMNEVLDQQGEEWTSHYEANAAGAEFGLYQNGELVQTVTIGEGSTVELELYVGEYELKEIKTSSDDYVLSNEVWNISVTKDGITVTNSKGEAVDLENNNELIIKNDLKQGEAEISKKEVGGSEELPGATLNIKGEGVDETWVSTTESKTFKLKEGVYTLTETIPNAGYELNTETITFEVKDGEVTKVVMHNKPLPKPVPKATPQAPMTGDYSAGAWVFITILSIATIAMIVMSIRKSKEKKKETQVY